MDDAGKLERVGNWREKAWCFSATTELHGATLSLGPIFQHHTLNVLSNSLRQHVSDKWLEVPSLPFDQMNP